MHLKSYQESLRLEQSGIQVPSFGNQQGALLKTCGSNQSTSQSSGRLPFSVISNNTLRRSSTANSSGSVASVWLKPSRNSAPHVHLLSPGCENDTLRFYQSEDTDSPLDIWTVIKPGHVREKIAIFASEGESGDHCSASADRTSPTNTRGAKAKSSWEEKSSAKRRRRSGSNHRPAPHQSETSMNEGDMVAEAEEDEELKVSVVEMVAFLEQRANEQQTDCKPSLTLQRSSTTITLSRAPPTEVKEEEAESVRVSDMVARLESKCLRRRSQGDVSRSNSLRRTVGRVLLVSAEQSPSHSSPMSSLQKTPCNSDHAASPDQNASPHPVFDEADGRSCQVTAPQGEEPPPGLLFLCPITNSNSSPSHPKNDSEPAVSPSPDPPEAEGGTMDFLLMRQRVRQLLEPQPLLALLPHHLLVSIFLLLDTRSLAALKCACRYFNFLIQTYGIRPADALWVSHPRYRDDPCKQCKKRYFRGDVSLCRWHHKAFCQPLPHGPGFWMCCHGNHRDTPGCNVGLHDNRWVPTFHSINSPVCGRSQNIE